MQWLPVITLALSILLAVAGFGVAYGRLEYRLTVIETSETVEAQQREDFIERFYQLEQSFVDKVGTFNRRLSRMEGRLDAFREPTP